MEKWKKIGALIAVAVGIISLLRTIILNWNSYLLDFSVYYHASTLAVHHLNPYLIDNSSKLQYLYPSFGLFFMFWLPLLRLEIMEKIWILCSIGSFIFTIYILSKLQKYSFLTISLFFLGCVVSFPFKFTLGMGQINLIIMLLIVLFLYFVNGKPFISSAFLASAIALKLFPILFLLPLFLHKKLKIVIMTALILLSLVLFSLVYFGVSLNLYYLIHMMIPLLAQNSGVQYYNQSMAASMNRMGIPHTLSIFFNILVLLISIFLIVKKKLSVHESLLVFIPTILLINSVTWQHHLILIAIPIYFLIKYVKKMIILIYMLTAIVLLSINIPHSFEQYQGIILSHGFLGVFIIWIVQLYCYTKGPSRI
jgi:hypothetical protein